MQLTNNSISHLIESRHTLPVASLVNVQDSSDYFDTISRLSFPEKIMQFSHNGRDGIILSVEGRPFSNRVEHIRVGDIPIACQEETWLIFQHHTNRDLWVMNPGYGSLKKTIDARHNETNHEGSSALECPSCPFLSSRIISDELLANLLADTDPDVQLGPRVPFQPCIIL